MAERTREKLTTKKENFAKIGNPFRSRGSDGGDGRGQSHFFSQPEWWQESKLNADGSSSASYGFRGLLAVQLARVGSNPNSYRLQEGGKGGIS